MNLLKECGVDVSQWKNYKGASPAANPKYCYNWSFEQPGLPIMKLASRYRSLPLHRRWMIDFGHFARKTLPVGANYTINIAAVAAARAMHAPSMSWGAIWLRAFALISQRRPELRTIYLPFPWPRLYVHPHFVCSVAIERTWRGASAVFMDPIPNVETLSLAEIDAKVRHLKTVPVENIGGYRRLIRITKLPLLIRRLLWRIVLYCSGRMHAKYLGNLVLNSVPVLRGDVMQSMMPTTFLMYYNLVQPNGDTLVQLLFDHCVLDGIAAYRIILDVEATLKRDIVAELQRDFPIS